MQPFAGLLLLCHAFGLSLVFADCADITVFYFLNFTANRHKAAIIPFVATLFPSVAAADSFGLSAEVCNAFCSHRLSVVPWGGLNIVRCYSFDCLNMSGGLLVAGAKMRLCATSGGFALTPFADVHAAPIKSVDAAE